MKFHYAGKYSGNPEDLPHHEPVPGAVQITGAKDAKDLGKKANAISVILIFVLFLVIIVRAENFDFKFLVLILYLLSLLPHELLHAVCYNSDVYLYTDLKHGMIFVTGPGNWTKSGFILKCLLPGIVLGFIPFIIFLIEPSLLILGEFGALGIAGAAGDFYNARNAMKQMPKGSRAYNDRDKTFWYVP